MMYFAEGSPDTVIDSAHAAQLMTYLLERCRPGRRVLLVPPDFTRFASGAGPLTCLLYERLRGSAHVEVLPALGTHTPLTPREIAAMFPGIPAGAFCVHDWRRDLARLGEIPGAFVRRITGDRLDFPIPCEVNRRLVAGRWDRIISLGQVVPHEVAGIAGHSKNIFIGLGGRETINRTHFVGAICGMERVMGRAASPVRDILHYLTRHCARDLPISYVLIVRGRTDAGEPVTRGLFAGDDESCFDQAAALCQQVNLTLLDEPLHAVVVYVDPTACKSTWLANKAIYRTRLAIADGGELAVLAPGVSRFGEDEAIDRLIRAYGYRGTPNTLRAVRDNPDLASELSAAAHLIHGSSEGRFRITYCPGGLTQAEIERVGYEWGDLGAALARYGPCGSDGWRTTADGERVYFIKNPGQGLWALRSQFPTRSSAA